MDVSALSRAGVAVQAAVPDPGKIMPLSGKVRVRSGNGSRVAVPETGAVGDVTVDIKVGEPGSDVTVAAGAAGITGVDVTGAG